MINWLSRFMFLAKIIDEMLVQNFQNRGFCRNNVTMTSRWRHWRKGDSFSSQMKPYLISVRSYLTFGSSRLEFRKQQENQLGANSIKLVEQLLRHYRCHETKGVSVNWIAKRRSCGVLALRRANCSEIHILRKNSDGRFRVCLVCLV